MKLRDKNTVSFYSWHSVERYAERFLDDKDAEIDDVFIGDMLIFNTQHKAQTIITKVEKRLCWSVQMGVSWEK